MVGCLDCHKLHNAKTTCTTCHAAWAPEMVVEKKQWGGCVNRIWPTAFCFRVWPDRCQSPTLRNL